MGFNRALDGAAAIVGVNGAGKTTLARLLCRQSGSIEIDGTDLDTRSRLDIDVGQECPWPSHPLTCTVLLVYHACHSPDRWGE